MIVLHRVLILLAFATGILAVITRFWAPEPLIMILPITWLRVAGLLLLYAMALMLAQMTEIMQTQARKKS